jgi:SAM-dependent methyltransferase
MNGSGMQKTEIRPQLGAAGSDGRAVRVIRRLPWWAKLYGKLALSWIPLKTPFFRRTGLYRHGAMMNPDSALRWYLDHVEEWALPHLSNSTNLSILELGPGDSVSTALIAACRRQRETILVDSGQQADLNRSHYDSLIEVLSRLHPGKPILERMRSAPTLTDLLNICNARYLTKGLSSLRSLPEACVDVVFSAAVMEHILLKDVTPLLAELFRVLRPGGVMVHTIDFRDHLAESLNSLRFSERVWESAPFQNSGCYTNRLGADAFSQTIETLGFCPISRRDDVWDAIPIAPGDLHHSFRGRHDLRVWCSRLIHQKPMYN